MNSTIKLTNKQALSLNTIMQGLRDKGRISFRFFISLNVKKLKDVLSPLEDISNENRRVRSAYDAELRDTVLIPYAKKDNRGNPLIEGNGAFFINISEELQEKEDNEDNISEELKIEIDTNRKEREGIANKLIEDLGEKHKVNLAEFEKRDAELAELLDEEITIKLRLVNYLDIPDDTPSAVIELLIEHKLIIE